jgi:hypothetical protein
MIVEAVCTPPVDKTAAGPAEDLQNLLAIHVLLQATSKNVAFQQMAGGPKSSRAVIRKIDLTSTHRPYRCN